MKVQTKFFLLGAVLALFLCIGIAVVFIRLVDSRTPKEMFYLEQMLPSGKALKVTSANLNLGAEHNTRYQGQDSFYLRYISSVPAAETRERDQEALDAFELIRPISEQWKINTVYLMVYQSIQRDSAFETYTFERSSSGSWSFKRYPAKN